MAKQFFPLLPKLKEASAVNPDKANVWEDESRDFLNALIKSLAVSGTIKDIGTIDSIPDVWARPLLFQMALFDEQKKETQQFIRGLHERVLGEWRCILAMIALKDVKQLNLRSVAVHIDQEESGFGHILFKLAPQESIQPSTTTWKDIYVLSYQGIPIALTSPSTLVAAAADYQTAFHGTLAEPWSKDGVTLMDPVDYLTEEDRAALYGWISKLYEEIRATVPRVEQEDSPSCMGVLRCLDDYRQDIKRKLSMPASADVARVDAELNLNMGIFRLMNQTVKAKKATAQDSAVRLIASQGRKPNRDILLISPIMVREFAEQLGVPPTQLVVWRGVSANDVSEEDLQGEKTKLGCINLGNVEWHSPDEFFTDRMTVIEPGNAIVGSRSIAGAQMLAEDDTSAILPIRRELLEYFSAQEIAERISIENNIDDICVQFSFPLSGIGGEQANFKFTKRYPKKDLVYLQTNVPVIEIWPNVRREGWKKYYLYYENSDAQNENSQEIGRDFFYVDPWAYGEDIGADVPDHGLANRYTAQLSGFPEALLCTVNMSQQGSMAAQTMDAGILLLSQPPLVTREGELTWQFGIDFGTSSTMLYFREGSKQPQPLSFDPHLFQVTDSGIPRTRTFINFIPSLMEGRNDGSFLSIFHMLNTQTMHQEILPLQDGHVFMLTTQRIEFFRKLSNRIDANLKWKDDDIGRRKVAAYVKQICIQSVAEAAIRGVDKLNWNFSFPTAFSKEQQFAFKATCQDAVAEACRNTCFEIPESTIVPWPESKASAYYFNKLGKSDTNFSDGAICLDIGAGTTDISIISGQPGRIVYHTSIQFAGRYLFLPIYRQYSLFNQNMPNTDGVDEEQQQAIIDADMREHSEDYLKNLKNITGREEVKQVLQLSQLAMAGIFYYLGNVLALLHEQGIYREDHVPDIFVGGNGSRIFTWLTGGIFDTANPFMEVLKHAIIASSGLSPDSRFRIQLSDSPKIEVACGMIETRPHNDSEFYDEKRQSMDLFGKAVDEYTAASVIVGESCRIQEKDWDKDTLISAQDISNGVWVESMDELDRFLDAFNRDQHIWSDGIEVDEDQKSDIQKLVNSFYVSEKDKDVKKIFVEPVFIVELKKMMEMLAK